MDRFGGAREDWLDLSTGINPVPYPVPALPEAVWSNLPTTTERNALIRAARQFYDCNATPLPLAGAQAAIQLIPLLAPPGRATVLGPTYNEHAAAFRAHGWDVSETGAADRIDDGNALVIVNPNNPDGRTFSASELADMAARTSLLLVDESFADTDETLSVARDLPENAIVLRSFGKFFGLAGLRLGFAIAHSETAARLAELAGPWAVSGPALAIGRQALSDLDWQNTTRSRLRSDAMRLDDLASQVGWRCIGGTPLFRLYETPDARQAQQSLAAGRVWSRVFPYSRTWIRLGLPAPERWDQLAAALCI